MVWMPLVHPTTAQRTVKVDKTEEKGSDVNLATYLLLDACPPRTRTAPCA
jgi:hypothetical protein